MKPAKRRELVREIRQAYQLNELRTCGLIGITRWSNRYQSRRDPQTELRVRLRGSSFHANPLRLSETDGHVAARRLACKHQACLPTLPRRRAGATDEEESQESGPNADQACRSELSESTVEHGLRE